MVNKADTKDRKNDNPKQYCRKGLLVLLIEIKRRLLNPQFLFALDQLEKLEKEYHDFYGRTDLWFDEQCRLHDSYDEIFLKIEKSQKIHFNLLEKFQKNFPDVHDREHKTTSEEEVALEEIALANRTKLLHQRELNVLKASIKDDVLYEQLVAKENNLVKAYHTAIVDFSETFGIRGLLIPQDLPNYENYAETMRASYADNWPDKLSDEENFFLKMLEGGLLPDNKRGLVKEKNIVIHENELAIDLSFKKTPDSSPADMKNRLTLILKRTWKKQMPDKGKCEKTPVNLISISDDFDSVNVSLNYNSSNISETVDVIYEKVILILEAAANRHLESECKRLNTWGYFLEWCRLEHKHGWKGGHLSLIQKFHSYMRQKVPDVCLKTIRNRIKQTYEEITGEKYDDQDMHSLIKMMFGSEATDGVTRFWMKRRLGFGLSKQEDIENSTGTESQEDLVHDDLKLALLDCIENKEYEKARLLLEGEELFTYDKKYYETLVLCGEERFVEAGKILDELTSLSSSKDESITKLISLIDDKVASLQSVEDYVRKNKLSDIVSYDRRCNQVLLDRALEQDLAAEDSSYMSREQQELSLFEEYKR